MCWANVYLFRRIHAIYCGFVHSHLYASPSTTLYKTWPCFFLPQLHILVPKLAFWGDFIIVRYHFSTRKLKSTLKPSKNVVCRPKTTFVFWKMCFRKRGAFFLNFPALHGPGPGPVCSSRARAGPIWAHISDFEFNFAHFGFKIEFLTKCLDDSAWFCVEKLKNIVWDPKT